jgi:hypothetical protein
VARVYGDPQPIRGGRRRNQDGCTVIDGAG